jgi:23S rRNA (cytosine1962-C5)-methyltransferase
LTVDWFARHLLVTAFDPVWEHFEWVIWADELRRVIPSLASVSLQRRYGEQKGAEVLSGNLEAPVVAREAGLRYHVNLSARQNVGLFLDMAPGRAWVRAAAKGRRVLNLFAYTCAFSVAAVAGGAHHVVNVDMSRPSLRTGARNHELNGLDPRSATFLGHDIFRSWGKLTRLGPYDLVIVDPPSFQKGSFDARKDYPKLMRRFPDLMPQGGDVLLCLNDPDLDHGFLKNTIAAACPSAAFETYLPASLDFAQVEPERGLKVQHWRMR